MIKAINLDEPIEYICKDDKKDENPTVWLFRPLLISESVWRKKEVAKLAKLDLGERKFAIMDKESDFLSVCLIGAKNWGSTFEREDEEVLPNVKRIKEKCLSAIPYGYRDELLGFCFSEYEELEETEAKN